MIAIKYYKTNKIENCRKWSTRRANRNERTNRSGVLNVHDLNYDTILRLWRTLEPNQRTFLGSKNNEQLTMTTLKWKVTKILRKTHQFDVTIFRFHVHFIVDFCAEKLSHCQNSNCALDIQKMFVSNNRKISKSTEGAHTLHENFCISSNTIHRNSCKSFCQLMRRRFRPFSGFCFPFPLTMLSHRLRSKRTSSKTPHTHTNIHSCWCPLHHLFKFISNKLQNVSHKM